MKPRIGFVLSGFASYAAVHVGMLRALIAAGVVPDFVVGISIGAGNAAWLAARPNAAGVEDLRRAWLEVARHDVPLFNPAVAARAFLESLPNPLSRRAKRESQKIDATRSTQSH